MRTRKVALCGLAALGAVAPPARASSYVVTVYDDLSACATVDFGQPVTGAGTFAALGAVTGPRAAGAPVAGSRPIVLAGQGSWYGCLAGAYAGASGGGVVYTLAFTTEDASFTSVTVCEPRPGAVVCR